MSKTLQTYLDRYLKILDLTTAEATVPPVEWIFDMWKVDESDPALSAVIRQGIENELERLKEQNELKDLGANPIDIIKASKNIELVSISQAREEALQLRK